MVCRAVERPHRRRGKATGRIDLAAEQHQLGVAVLLAALGEQGFPGVFGVAQDRGDELGLLVVGRRRLAARAAGCLLLLLHLAGELTKNLQRVLAGEPADTDNQQHRTKPEPLAAAETHAAATTFASGIDHIVAASAFSPIHECSPKRETRRQRLVHDSGERQAKVLMHNQMVMFDVADFNIHCALPA
ncbi:hypothetical protein PPS11_19444 [Pseudomonas putida S11]|nr:hypothetical protein PPS11_19444 [Pseudomonas putida S11]